MAKKPLQNEKKIHHLLLRTLITIHYNKRYSANRTKIKLTNKKHTFVNKTVRVEPLQFVNLLPGIACHLNDQLHQWCYNVNLNRNVDQP